MLFFVAGATRIGPQDIAALMTRQPAVSDRWREHLMASPLGAIRVASISLPRPLGTLAPEPEVVRLARFNADPNAVQVNRGSKGDLLVPRLQLDISAELLREDMKAAGLADDTDELDVALRYEPFPEYDISLSLELHPQVPQAAVASASPDATVAPDADEAGGVFGVTRLYFEGVPMNASLPGIEPWEVGEAPLLVVPAGPTVVAELTAGLTALAYGVDATGPDASAPAAQGVTVASKTEPAGGASRRKPPAELLRLTGKTRARAEKCLANAVYFEARSEPVRGQVAVAQVVLNRAFSGYYPNDVCGVVYQNANRHLSCQFTFACDGIPDVVTEPEHWERAMRIAKATLDGRIWLDDVGKATHYHASYVYPYWVRSMRKHKKIGLHTFYRPRKWGDGSDAPSWGLGVGAGSAAELVAKL